MDDIDRAAKFIHESNLIEDVAAKSFAIIREELEHGAAVGHVSAFRHFMGTAKHRVPLLENDLHLAHRLIIMEQLELEYGWDPQQGLPEEITDRVGKWRPFNLPEGYGYASCSVIAERMAGLFTRVHAFLGQARPSDDDIIDFAADLHYDYIKIHPYFDGNGRTGRLLANYVLAFYGLPVAVFTRHDRENAYYTAMAATSSTILRHYLRLKMR